MYLGVQRKFKLSFSTASRSAMSQSTGFCCRTLVNRCFGISAAFDEKRATNELGLIGRKAVVEYVSDISQSYRTFYDYINSVLFLNAMSKLTGIQDLIADKTLFGGGTHNNLSGQGLDVHIDFNIDERKMLHRRINLLIYLNKEWEEAWGGAIESHSNPRDAAVDEIVSFLPLFNRAVIFETNEYSWHGFRRITLPPDKQHLSRKSFSISVYEGPACRGSFSSSHNLLRSATATS